MAYGGHVTHFGHTNIIKHCGRPFAHTHEMNTTMVNNWNALVGPKDVVWHLGDFSFRGQHPRTYLKLLNGQINICLGNHDKKKKLLECVDEGLLDKVVEVHYLKWEKKRFWLSHYAHVVWSGSHRGVVHAFGHSHGTLQRHSYRSMDVGMDAMGFCPVHINTVWNTLNAQQEQAVDYHIPRDT